MKSNSSFVDGKAFLVLHDDDRKRFVEFWLLRQRTSKGSSSPTQQSTDHRPPRTLQLNNVSQQGVEKYEILLKDQKSDS
jgi:hypothetical protein